MHDSFPTTRLRRLRQQPWIRQLVQEITLTPSDLILPLFIREVDGLPEIRGLPGVRRLTIEEALEVSAEALKVGIPAVILFPAIPAHLKDMQGTEAFSETNLMCRAAKAFKKNLPELGVIIDVALDPYTIHGHDGVLTAQGAVDNDATLPLLARQACILADAGVDCVAPSDMMDGRVGVLRAALDAAGFTQTLICAYAAKYASCFYGPFRDAVGSQGCLKGDKKTYQMDPANRREALREARLDVQEGADMLIVKPGLPYLDIISDLADALETPTLAYQVSAEYAMIMAGAEAGWLDADRAFLESLTAMKRAGARGIVTYAALHVSRLLK